MVDNKVMIGGVSATLVVLVGLGFLAFNDNPTHFCEDRNMMAHCYELSGTGKTCYTLPTYKGGKRCSSIWQGIETTPIILEGVKKIETNDFTRDPDGVHCYTKGDLRRKVNCNG